MHPSPIWRGVGGEGQQESIMESIIDPPVGPFSDRQDIEDWIRELDRMPPSKARDHCLQEARQWLEQSQAPRGPYGI